MSITIDMIKLQSRNIELKEIDKLEELLDSLLGVRGKDGITTGPNFEEVSGKWHAGRSFSYLSREGGVNLRACLEDNGKYYVELYLDLTEQDYKLLLQQCQRQAPTIYTQLQKPDDKRVASL